MLVGVVEAVEAGERAGLGTCCWPQVVLNQAQGRQRCQEHQLVVVVARRPVSSQNRVHLTTDCSVVIVCDLPTQQLTEMEQLVGTRSYQHRVCVHGDVD